MRGTKNAHLAIIASVALVCVRSVSEAGDPLSGGRVWPKSILATVTREANIA